MRAVYAFHLRHLQPHLYHLRLEVITFPAGRLGDAGVFLSW